MKKFSSVQFRSLDQTYKLHIVNTHTHTITHIHTHTITINLSITKGFQIKKLINGVRELTTRHNYYYSPFINRVSQKNALKGF